MNPDSPLTLEMKGFDFGDFEQFLQNPCRPTASCVMIRFQVDAHGRGVVLRDGNEMECLLKSSHDLVSWMGKIYDHLPALYFLVLNFCVESHGAPHSLYLPNFPVEALALVFQKKRTLRFFKVDGDSVRIGGIGASSGEEFQSAFDHLARMHRLEHFHLGPGVSWSPEPNSQDMPLFLALNDIGTLRNMSLTALHRMDTVCQSLQMLQQNRTLKSLKLLFRYGSYLNAPVPPEALADAVGSLVSLKTLQLFAFVSVSHLGELVSFHNGISALLGGLKRNQSLALVNIALKHFRYDAGTDIFFCPPGFDQGKNQGFQRHLNIALRTNLTLTEVNLKVVDQTEASYVYLPNCYPVQFWLKMNRIGRKALLEDFQHKRWISVLIDQKDDHQVCFYLLSANLSVYLPFLLQASNHGQLAEVYPQKKAKLNHP